VSYLRTAGERAAFARTFYPTTDIYRNQLGIRNHSLLEQTERALTAQRAEQGFPRTANFKSYAGFKAIHRHLFQNLYTWAGKERLDTTGRGQVPFAVPAHIHPWMTEQFAQLQARQYLIGISLEAFASSAAVAVNEIDAAHPFIDGNGRTQRFWLRMLADNAGFELRLSNGDRRRWNEASRQGFMMANHTAMASLLKLRLKMY
jgi:cell filamentation protein